MLKSVLRDQPALRFWREIQSNELSWNHWGDCCCKCHQAPLWGFCLSLKMIHTRQLHYRNPPPPTPTTAACVPTGLNVNSGEKWDQKWWVIMFLRCLLLYWKRQNLLSTLRVQINWSQWMQSKLLLFFSHYWNSVNPRYCSYSFWYTGKSVSL